MHSIKDFDRKITELEGKKISLSIAQIGEVRRIIAKLLFADSLEDNRLYVMLLKNGEQAYIRDNKKGN